MSNFLKTIKIQIKTTSSDKTYTKKVNLYFIREKFGTFPRCDLVTIPQEMSKKAKFI